MRLVAAALVALVLAVPAGAAEREVRFGDPFRLEVASPGPFDRLSDGRLVCLSEACAGRTLTLGGSTIRVRSRVTREQVAAAKPSYRTPDALPPASGAGRTATFLFGAAAVAAVLALALALARRRGPAAEHRVDLLQRALRLVRESSSRPPPDRRRALDHLAATLGEAPPAERATRLAWARPEPDPATTRAVADEVGR
jgi:hypothetical protein